MRPLHPYVLLRCDACGMLAEPSVSLRGAASSEAAEASEREHGGDAPLSSGLLLFSRDGELRYEEPPLCARCSMAIGVTALERWAEEEEEG